MTTATYVSFRPLKVSDSEHVSNLLLNSSFDYVRYFHPFDSDVLSIRNQLDAATNDKYFGIELDDLGLNGPNLVGFYMLRGLDEGYLDPMYGVFIAQHWCNMGIARLSLYHAECFCKINSYKRLLLKVNIANYKAKSLYKSFGFKADREDAKNGNIVLIKNL